MNSSLVVAPKFAEPPGRPAVPGFQWLQSVYSLDVMAWIDELKAAITCMFGAVLKLDSTKMVNNNYLHTLNFFQQSRLYQGEWIIELLFSIVKIKCLLSLFPRLWWSWLAMWWHRFLGNQRRQWVWPSCHVRADMPGRLRAWTDGAWAYRQSWCAPSSTAIRRSWLLWRQPSACHVRGVDLSAGVPGHISLHVTLLSWVHHRPPPAVWGVYVWTVMLHLRVEQGRPGPPARCQTLRAPEERDRAGRRQWCCAPPDQTWAGPALPLPDTGYSRDDCPPGWFDMGAQQGGGRDTLGTLRSGEDGHHLGQPAPAYGLRPRPGWLLPVREGRRVEEGRRHAAHLPLCPWIYIIGVVPSPSGQIHPK